MTRFLANLLVIPGFPSRPGLWRWLLWVPAALMGIPSLRRADGKPRGPVLWTVRLLQGVAVRVVALVVTGALVAVGLVRGSLPQLHGEARLPALTAEVRVERDGLGVPTLHADSRVDLAAALGYLHAQERYFQMDLSRRVAAGELAALLGPGSPQRPLADVDRHFRVHRFRVRAGQVLATFTEAERAELDAYVAGVNAGLDALAVRPFEYLLLGVNPEPWSAEDSVLVAMSMFLSLQEMMISRESDRGVAEETLPGPLCRFLLPSGGSWDAALDGSTFPPPALPSARMIDLRRKFAPAPPAVPDLPPMPGSNNWAVAGRLTAHGAALVANDMHLGIRVPNTWYRAAFAWPDSRNGSACHAWGATLPGVPGLIIGSNGHVAWGFTNSAIDTSDLIRLEFAPDNLSRYRTPDGFHSFTVHEEVIHVRGRPDEVYPVRETVWGPVLDDTDYHRSHPHAVRWVAHDAEAVNFRQLDLLEARTLDRAIDVATHSGGPHVNFVAGDAEGNIGWTLLGRLPRRVGFDGRTPVSWADGSCRWDGYRDPGETPRIVNPADARLWTANNRVVGGAELERLGHGGYDRGARAGQIRDGLASLKTCDEAAMLAIQRDDRALFLDRWQKLLARVLHQPDRTDDARWQTMHRLVDAWGIRAARESVGYRLVSEFRTEVLAAVVDPLTAPCRRLDDKCSVSRHPELEDAVWRLLDERPMHLLDPQYETWDALLVRSVDRVLEKVGPGLETHTWGEQNRTQIDHPLSGGLRGAPLVGPLLHGWLQPDMPSEPLSGARSDMPCIQGPTFGASQRMVVSPGHEESGYFHMPCGQSGHPLSPHYRDSHAAWAQREPTPFLPGPTTHTLRLVP